MDLTGKVAIVTGAARGIGFAIAKRFLQDGARVVMADIDHSTGNRARESLEPLGDVRFVQADVGTRLDVHNMVATTIDVFDAVDILVNNAGIASSGSFLDISEDDFDAVMRVNLRGAFLCTQAVAKRMVARVENGGPPGSIVSLSSVAAQLAIGDQVAYTISKGGLAQLTVVAAQALAPHGIRVNAIGPGSIETDLLMEVVGEDQQDLLARTPLGRIGQPHEIAAIASFLASDGASYITGQTIYADGGRMGLNGLVPVEAPQE